ICTTDRVLGRRWVGMLFPRKGAQSFPHQYVFVGIAVFPFWCIKGEGYLLLKDQDEIRTTKSKMSEHIPFLYPGSRNYGFFEIHRSNGHHADGHQGYQTEFFSFQNNTTSG